MKLRLTRSLISNFLCSTEGIMGEPMKIRLYTVFLWLWSVSHGLTLWLKAMKHRRYFEDKARVQVVAYRVASHASKNISNHSHNKSHFMKLQTEQLQDSSWWTDSQAPNTDPWASTWRQWWGKNLRSELDSMVGGHLISWYVIKVNMSLKY